MNASLFTCAWQLLPPMSYLVIPASSPGLPVAAACRFVAPGRRVRSARGPPGLQAWGVLPQGLCFSVGTFYLRWGPNDRKNTTKTE